MALSGVLIPGEDWQLAVDTTRFVDAACTDADGNFYFSDMKGDGIVKLALDGKQSVLIPAKGVSGLKWGPDGRLYACNNALKQLIAYHTDGTADVLAENVGVNDLVVDCKGRVYFTETGKHQVVLCESPGKTRAVDVGIPAPNGIAFSPNQETLAVSDYSGTGIYALRVETDGSLSSKMPIMPFRQFGPKPEAKGDAMVCDTRARFYCSTATGVQVYDPNGRPIGLILSPTGTPITSIALSGPELGYLFVLTQGKVFKRKVNAKGFLTSLPSILGEEKK
jgi:enterochelin esterase family protein